MQTQQAENGVEAAPESRRERVRRCLIRPLVQDGFRKPAKVKLEAHEAMLTKLADELSHMSERGLLTLRRALEAKGGGKKRDEWPTLATVRGFAELVEPRPLDAVPELLRWFRSVEGPRAIREGTLVETWAYWQRWKRPPVQPAARKQLLEQAAENRRRLQIVAERIAGGRADESDVAWRDRYEAERRRIEGLVVELREDAS